MAAKSDKGRGERRRLRAIKALAEMEGANLALPAEEVRCLVLRIILADEVAPFVGRMVAVRDDLKAGRTAALTRVARQSRNRPLSALLSAISRAAERGRVEEAEATAFYAASYAYRNSLDYLRALLSYLDSFRPPRRRRAR
jgi:hypothetical protein